MIFITLGSQKFQFNRLLKAVDSLVERGIITDKVFAQIGYSDYIPKFYKYKAFLDRNEFSKLVEKSEIIITHGGTGAIIGAIRKGKKLIAIPRLKKYGEHVDDHQLQLVKQFDEMNLICSCDNCDLIEKALLKVKKTEYNSYISNTNTIISSIRNFIEEVNI